MKVLRASLILFLAILVPSFGGDKLKALIIDGQNNHNWQSVQPVIKEALEVCGRFDVEVTSTPDNKAPKEAWDGWKPDFSKYDVLVSNYNGQMWPEDLQKSFVEYMKNGGGLVIIHAADNSWGQWDEYNRMIGLGGWGGRNEKTGPYYYYDPDKDAMVKDMTPGGGGTHGAQQEFVVTIRQPDHPIVKGMPKEWLHAKDELYANLRGPAEQCEILATAFSDKTNKHEPQLMAIQYHKGRVFHNAMGHADYSMRCVGFYTSLQRGTEWAATGKVTLPIPDNFPTKDKVVPVAAK